MGGVDWGVEGGSGVVGSVAVGWLGGGCVVGGWLACGGVGGWSVAEGGLGWHGYLRSRNARAAATSSAVGWGRLARSHRVHATLRHLSAPRAVTAPQDNALSNNAVASRRGWNCRRRTGPGTSAFVNQPCSCHRRMALALASATRARTIAVGSGWSSNMGTAAVVGRIRTRR